MKGSEMEDYFALRISYLVTKHLYQLILTKFWYGLYPSLDMAAERNALMERIYPRLKEFAQEKGYEFQVGLIKGTTYYPAKDMIFLVFWTLARYLGQSY